jgi:uncharacterized protein
LEKYSINKRKIINDPVHGFISISSDLIYDLIQHPYFQRLRRIKQLGLTSLVYPGATHSRFQHAIGALHLTNLAIDVIRTKGHIITNEEAEAVQAAVLLHDIGHGPFSHALETSIIEDIRHEDISLILMKVLNNESGGRLEMAIDIFNDRYSKKFLHQLVAGQLDMDRLDYLKRDSFYTGVTEGIVGSDRIIKMLNVVDDQLVVESKGIYSIEKFLIARRLMYWQVYFHKTVVAAEYQLVNMLKRAKQLAMPGDNISATYSLSFFLKNTIKLSDLEKALIRGNDLKVIECFTGLDDDDIYSSAKAWMKHNDKALSKLAADFINRRLFRIEIQKQAFQPERIVHLKAVLQKQLGIPASLADLFVFNDEITNFAYNTNDERIQILYNSGHIEDISDASDMLNLTVLSKVVKKYFLCYPKELIDAFEK